MIHKGVNPAETTSFRGYLRHADASTVTLLFMALGPKGDLVHRFCGSPLVIGFVGSVETYIYFPYLS